MILLHSVRLRVPKVVIARMVFNTGLDLLAGVVPLLGDLFDAGFKANLRNLALLERHARRGVAPERSDYVFVAVLHRGPRAARRSCRSRSPWWLLSADQPGLLTPTLTRRAARRSAADLRRGRRPP